MTVEAGHDGEVGVRIWWLDGVMHIAGEIDSHTCRFVNDALAAHPLDDELRIDLCDVTFCDSSCVACFVLAARDRQLVLVAPTPQVARVFELVHLEQVPGIDIES